jgi:HAD superfamily phosphatase
MSAKANLLIFDMDGVLVDVTASYRQAVIETVKHFTGFQITNKDIQARKNRGSANNDWDLALEMIREHGVSPSREEVIAVFQRIYLGSNCTGLIRNERWLADRGLLPRLAEDWRLSLFTGRERWEALYTLSKFGVRDLFDPVIGMEDVIREKPDPDGLLRILRTANQATAYYIGDTMDDCRAAQSAAVSFIGVAGPDNPLRDDLRASFEKEGSFAVISDLNELERTLP